MRVFRFHSCFGFPVSLVLLGFLFTFKAEAQEIDVVGRWLQTNSGVRTLKVTFSQSRKLRSLNLPIQQKGILWLDYERDRFRWETGSPPQTIVVRNGNDLLILRTRAKKVERRTYGTGSSVTPGMSALATGFPRSASEFRRKYRVLEIQSQGGKYRVITQPLGSGGRGVSRFTFLIDARTFRLEGFEISLTDGSSISTSFSRVEPNVRLSPALFSPDLTGYGETKF